MIELLNWVGIGNAEKWLCEFSFAKYAKPLFDRFGEWVGRLCAALESYLKKYGILLPGYVAQKVKALIFEFKKLREDGSKFWDKAINYLDDLLGKVKEKIKPDGTGASKELEHNIPVSESPTTRAPESQQRDVLPGGTDVEVVPLVRTGNSGFLACLFPYQAAFFKFCS